MTSLQQRLIPLVPFLFVLLWSTGFIGAQYGLPYIEPFYLLFLRMIATLAVFLGLIAILKCQWPTLRQGGHQMITGSLVHAAYLGGVFAAIKLGMPAGIVAIIVGLQPLLTVLAARIWLNQAISGTQMTGMILGLAGIVLVLGASRNMDTSGLSASALLASLVALFGITLGTLYQKRFGKEVDLLTGSFYQYLATALWMGALAWSFESREVIWSAPLFWALSWLVLVLSVSAILLLMYMIREGEASRVASYFYLVPPVTVIEAWLLFDESLNGFALTGIAVTVIGVYLVLKTPPTFTAEQDSGRGK